MPIQLKLLGVTAATVPAREDRSGFGCYCSDGYEYGCNSQAHGSDRKPGNGPQRGHSVN